MIGEIVRDEFGFVVRGAVVTHHIGEWRGQRSGHSLATNRIKAPLERRAGDGGALRHTFQAPRQRGRGDSLRHLLGGVELQHREQEGTGAVIDERIVRAARRHDIGIDGG